ADGQRIVVTSEVAKKLLIVDLAKGEVLKAIDTEGELSHMVVLSPDGRRAYVANLGSSSISVIDLESGTFIARIATGAGFSARKLHTDIDEIMFEAKRPIILNGIGDLAIAVGDAAGLQAYRASGASRPYAELRGPYWDPGDVGDNDNPPCPANTTGADWPDLVKDISLYALGESPATCAIGVDPTSRCRTLSVSLTAFSVLPALYIPDAVPGVSSDPPYNGFRWNDAPPSVPPAGFIDHDDRNVGTAGSELTRDDALVMHLLDEVAFFESPFATYFDDPDIHEPCMFKPLAAPYFLNDDYPGLDADPWNGVLTSVLDAGFSNLFDGDPATSVGGWFEADGRNEGNADCAGIATGNDPASWRPMRVRGRVNINTAPHSVLQATFGKACRLGLGNPGSGGFLSGDCRESDLTRLVTSVLRYREWVHLNPALPVGDPFQGSFSQWTFDTDHSAATTLEQYFLDLGLFDPFGGAMAGLTGVAAQDAWLEAHLAYAGNGGLLRPPFRTRTQLLDVAYGFAGLALSGDPRNLLDLDRALAMVDISGNDDRPSAAALFARIDQDLAVGSEGYRVETRGRFGIANAARFSIIALLDNGIDGGYLALAVESETSRGVANPTGLFYSGYYR
ncbi:hypothetical protein IIA16_03500, partial [bacterium]|nr:hypothetical protein [bacterium]